MLVYYKVYYVAFTLCINKLASISHVPLYRRGGTTMNCVFATFTWTWCSVRRGCEPSLVVGPFANFATMYNGYLAATDTRLCLLQQDCSKSTNFGIGVKIFLLWF